MTTTPQSRDTSVAEPGQKVQDPFTGWVIAAGIAGFIALYIWMQNDKSEPEHFTPGVPQENLAHIIHCQVLAEQLRTTPYEDAGYNSLDTKFHQECCDISSTALNFDPADLD